MSERCAFIGCERDAAATLVWGDDGYGLREVTFECADHAADASRNGSPGLPGSVRAVFAGVRRGISSAVTGHDGLSSV